MAIDRRIPAVMATQHPDNAGPPTWERHGDGFVSVREETAELLWCFRELGATEFMWDWEGKYADEAVVDRLRRPVLGWRIAPPQTVPDHEDDAADDPPIIDPRHTMR